MLNKEDIKGIKCGLLEGLSLYLLIQGICIFILTLFEKEFLPVTPVIYLLFIIFLSFSTLITSTVTGYTVRRVTGRYMIAGISGSILHFINLLLLFIVCNIIEIVSSTYVGFLDFILNGMRYVISDIRLLFRFFIIILIASFCSGLFGGLFGKKKEVFLNFKTFGGFAIIGIGLIIFSLILFVL